MAAAFGDALALRAVRSETRFALIELLTLPPSRQNDVLSVILSSRFGLLAIFVPDPFRYGSCPQP